MRIQFYGLTLLLMSMMAYGETCPCPTNYTVIEIGKTTLDEALKNCCKAVSQKTYKGKIQVPEKWSYDIKAPSNPVDSVQGSVEMIVTFDETQKVTNITANATSLTQSNCGNVATASYDASTPGTIQIGDDAKKVEAVCGKAKFIQYGVSQDNQNVPVVTELKYAGYIGSPPVTLIFQDSILTDIKK